MSNFDDMKLAVEALSGGTNTVILDDMGMPSIMVAVAKLLGSDLVEDATSDPHPAFVMGSNTLEKVYESKYQNIVMNNRAYSLPMQDPKAVINFDTALTTCRNKGEGWGIQPFSLWSAIALWCKKNGTMPRGNNNYGSDHLYPHERGVPTYTYTESGATKIGRTATGSGPATWYHDHTKHGIADLNGNVWEWCAGMRLVNGELQLIPYSNCMISTCDMSVNSADWKAISADGTFVAPGTNYTIKLDYINNKWSWVSSNTFTSQSDSSRGCPFANITTATNLSDNVKTLLRSYALLPEDGDTDYGGDYFYANNGAAERFPYRGGYWAGGAGAGVFSAGLRAPRSPANTAVGFRSAFYGTL